MFKLWVVMQAIKPLCVLVKILMLLLLLCACVYVYNELLFFSTVDIKINNEHITGSLSITIKTHKLTNADCLCLSL